MQEADTRSNRPQFTLRTLLVMVTLCAAVLAIDASLGLEFGLGFSGFFLSCVFVWLMVLLLVPFDLAAAKLPYFASFVVVPLLYCLLAFAFFFFGEAIDQPHPAYLRGNWVTVGLAGFLPFLPIVAIASVILVALDCSVQASRPRDTAYYPRFSNLRHLLRSFHTRLLLVVGVSLVLAYYAATVIEVWSAHQEPGGLIWPPKRVFVTCNCLWGLLWLADCVSRPHRGTVAAAIGFLCFTTFFLLPAEFGVLRE